MDNRKNTILLTVIAVATLLVAVVGATFAYFTAQGGNTVSNSITVETKAAASSSFSIDKNIALTANMTNFGQEGGRTQADTMTGTINFTAGTGAGAQTEFCYTATLAWTPMEPDFVDTGAAEEDLTLTVVKNDGQSDSTIWNNVAITTNEQRQAHTKIPVSSSEPSNYVHRIEATEAETKTNTIKVTVSFNYDSNHDQTANAGKALAGTLTLEKTDCN